MSKKLVKPTTKGQVTIPTEIRKQLGITLNTFLDVSVANGKVVMTPVKIEKDTGRDYSVSEIDNFLEEDKISKEDAEFFSKLLNRNS